MTRHHPSIKPVVKGWPSHGQGIICPDRFFWATRFLFLVFSYFFVSVPFPRLGWPSRQLWRARARKYTVSYRISYVHNISCGSWHAGRETDRQRNKQTDTHTYRQYFVHLRGGGRSNDVDDLIYCVVIDRCRWCCDQYGSYFGASLCAVDVNNDGFDDLLVGAPFYNQGLGDEGSVSLFLNLRSVRALLSSSRPESQTANCTTGAEMFLIYVLVFCRSIKRFNCSLIYEIYVQ